MRRGNFLALLTTVLCSACATSTAPPPAQSTASNGTGSTAAPEGVESPAEAGANRVPLGQLVRELGQQYRRNIVLMNGIEYYFAGPYTPDVAARDNIAGRIAEDTGMTLTRLPEYEFIHPPGFETLTEFSPSQQLSRRTANIATTIRVGADTPLYGAFALLSHSHGVTLIADNVIASALCGETTLHNVTLGDAVDAILRAARLTDATCSVEVDGDAALFYSPRAERRARLLANASNVTRPAALDRCVSLYLPRRPEDARRLLEESRAVPLENCAQSIGEQLGMRVEFDRNCRQLPVNPCVMSDVSIETAMRLLIRQWPLPLYGYTATEDTIRIVYLGPPTD